MEQRLLQSARSERRGGRGASDPWGLWGRLPAWGSRREFFPSANTARNSPVRGLDLKGDNDRQEGDKPPCRRRIRRGRRD